MEAIVGAYAALEALWWYLGALIAISIWEAWGERQLRKEFYKNILKRRKAWDGIY